MWGKHFKYTNIIQVTPRPAFKYHSQMSLQIRIDIVFGDTYEPLDVGYKRYEVNNWMEKVATN